MPSVGFFAMWRAGLFLANRSAAKVTPTIDVTVVAGELGANQRPSQTLGQQQNQPGMASTAMTASEVYTVDPFHN